MNFQSIFNFLFTASGIGELIYSAFPFTNTETFNLESGNSFYVLASNRYAAGGKVF